MAIYAMHLGTGHTLLCKSILSSTVATYCQQAATFLALFDEKERDARKIEGGSSIAVCLTKVIAELKRWESMPNRCEPFTLSMLRLQAQRVVAKSLDGLQASLKDWFTVSLHAGCRRGEWAQPKGSRTTTTFERDFKGDPRAFTLHDIKFFAEGRVRLTRDEALSSRDSVAYTDVTWRTQKNGDNGENGLFARNRATPEIDAITAWLSIVDRFIRLLGNRNDIPLGVYCNKITGEVYMITSAEIDPTMQSLATEIYKLDPTNPDDLKALLRFTSHSLRVGACNILHALGFKDYEIQRILRWRSTAFMLYLRNLAVVAQRHADAFTEASLMPSL
jgi:hypothetical protein